MNYDEIEWQWNLKNYSKAVQTIPKGCSTIAAMLSACIYQVCEDLKADKIDHIDTLDDEIANIFSNGLFDLNSTSTSINSSK